MRRWKDLISSSVFRIILLVLAVVIPLNLLTLVLGRRVMMEAAERAERDSAYTLQLGLNLVDDEAKRINRIMALIAMEDPDFLRLAGREITDEAERYRQVQNQTSLMTTLKNRLDEDQLAAGFFAYFPEKEIYSVATNRGSRSTLVRNEIIRLVMQQKESGYSRGALLNVNSRPVLLVMSNRRGALCGGWIELTEMTEWLSLSETRNIAFADRDGQIYFSNGGFPERVGSEKPNGRDHALIEAEAGYVNLRLIEAIPRRELFGSISAVNRALALLAVAALLLIPLSLFLLRRQVIGPVRRLMEAMREVEGGNVDYRIAEDRRAGSDFDRLNRSFNRTMDEVRDLKINLYEQELKAAKIRMGFLAQQIRPHFILNALNILYSYEKEEHELSQRMILCLSRYFRYVVSANTDFVPLGREMEHIRNYFEIQQARFPGTFHWELCCPETLEGCLIPPLLVQNLAENAIKHSFTPGESILIRVTAERLSGDRARIVIEDTGAGISDETLARIAEFQRTREFRADLGIGLQNSIDRLTLLYGDAAALRIGRIEPSGTRAQIEIPIRREEETELDRFAG